MNAVRGLSRLALAMSIVACATAPLLAQGNNPLIILPEDGQGSIQFPGAAAIPLPGILAPDPGPGGLALALTYNLLGPPSLVPGDILLFDGDILSDVIRFNAAGTSTGYPASVVFYSALESVGGELADTGFPSLLYQNQLRFAEGPLGYIYTPAQGQPGYVAGFSATYQLESVTATPEPASLVLFATGFLGIGAVRRKREPRTS